VLNLGVASDVHEPGRVGGCCLHRDGPYCSLTPMDKGAVSHVRIKI
jgi:hypothetical protein